MSDGIPRGRTASATGIVGRAAVVAVLGASIGLAVNALSAHGIPLRTPQSVTVADYVTWNLHVQGMLVRLEDARKAFDAQDALFIDARSARAYAAGHIPGALRLLSSEVPSRGKALLEDYAGDARIITYCSGGRCQSSMRLASQLILDLGFTNVGAFYEGWTAWRSAGYPIVSGEAP